MMPPRLSGRDRAEVERSAAEASRVVLAPVEVERYLDPPADTPYGMEYAFHLLGNVHGKTVLDFGCGSGENLIPLARRGAHVIALDISPELIELACRRLEHYEIAYDSVTLRVGTAYQTGLPDESIDVVFSNALLHHLDLHVVHNEIHRLLRSGGLFIFREPIRFSRTANWLRRLFPAPEGDVSDFEHPMTRKEIATITQGFTVLAERAFRLPFVPIFTKFNVCKKQIWLVDRWLLQHFPKLEHVATGKVMCVRK